MEDTENLSESHRFRKITVRSLGVRDKRRLQKTFAENFEKVCCLLSEASFRLFCLVY